MINFPYGISSFSLIRQEPYLYLDRTAAITTLEQAGRQLLFLRPRRFGKSLWLSVLESYYDVNQTDQFDELFGGLAIAKQPTPERNQYLIMRWDFSQVSPQGDIEQIQRSLFNHLNATVQSFIYKYSGRLTKTIAINPDDGLVSFRSALDVAEASGYQIYLLIDEYDNFANEVLMHGHGDKARYLDLLEGEGILKTLFKLVKAGAAENRIARVFITGVSPVVMSDMTSGYNVVTNITLEEEFAAVCGITEDELAALIGQVSDNTEQDTSHPAQIMETLRQFYNGYRFSPGEDIPSVYNPTLCFYFLRHYQKKQEAPRQMLDGNLAMDKGRIRYIAQLNRGRTIIDQALDEENPPAIPELAEDFGVENLQRVKQHERYMFSLLYYFGVLTLNGLDEFGGLRLSIPNLVVRALYLEELRLQALPDIKSEYPAEQVALQFFRDADLAPVVDFMEAKYFKVFSNRDYRWSNELTIKTIFASLLYNDVYYILDSEAELERGYSDLVMILRPSMRQFAGLQECVLEFKYLGLDEMGLSGEQLRNTERDALYEHPKVKAALQEALTQLKQYQTVLHKKYQEPHRLHCIAVVALGFERILWRAL